MKIENNIGWTDETTNAVTGCTKISPGCARCYAAVGTRARVLRGQGIETWGPNGVRYPVAQFAAKIRRLNKLCVCETCHTAHKISDTESFIGQPFPVGYFGKCKEPHCFIDEDTRSRLRRIRLFADSNSDWLDEKWPVETLAHFLAEIRQAPNIDVILLTKRIEKWGSRIEAVLKWIESNDCKWLDKTSNLPLRNWLADWFTLNKAPANIWLGVSVEDQKRADERIPQLRQTPAAVRFLSVEPLLEAVDLKLNTISITASWPAREFPTADNLKLSSKNALDWIIVGGESGKDRRDCGVDAIMSVAQQAIAAGVPVFVKQDCAFKSGQQGRIPSDVWARKEFPRR